MSWSGPEAHRWVEAHNSPSAGARRVLGHLGSGTGQTWLVAEVAGDAGWVEVQGGGVRKAWRGQSQGQGQGQGGGVLGLRGRGRTAG